MRPIRIVAYDPDWPARFEAERALLAPVFEGAGVRIEHVGSTAVPDLCGKPILDIMAGASSLRVFEERIPRLEAMDYEYASQHEVQFPMRRYLAKPRGSGNSVHLHCAELGGDWWTDTLLFRNHLRSNPDDARAYESLKRTLAREYGRDRDGYTDAKSTFIENAKAEARRRGR